MPFRPTLSLVAPVFNEAENIPRLAEETRRALAGYPAAWEMILVDDGSRDASWAAIEAAQAAGDGRVRGLRLSRNFGQTAAMSAGIDAAAHDVVVTLDADLQNDPADIPALLDKMGEGFEVVSGWRKARKDAFWTRTFPSRIANALISWITGVRLHDYGCSLKAYDRETVQCFRLYGEMHRFLPALCTWRGARVAEIPVNHRPRTAGASKYGIGRTLRVVLDLITVKFLLQFSTKPMHVFGGWGFAIGGLGFAVCAYLTWLKFVGGQDIGHRPLLFLGGLMVIVGLQLVMLGLISEFLARIYYESQGKTVYRLAHAHGGKPGGG